MYVIIRASAAGVHAGELVEYDAATTTATLTGARRLWRWYSRLSLSDLAEEGTPNPAECRFSVPVSRIIISGVCEVITCSAKGEQSIKGVPLPDPE